MADNLDKKRIRKASLAVADGGAATPTALYLLTNVGTTRTCVLRKIMGTNLCGANSILSIGTGLGAAWAIVFPTILTLNGLDFILIEDEIPAIVFEQDITFQVSVTGVTIMVEVSEIE